MDVGSRPRLFLFLAVVPILAAGLYLSATLTLADSYARSDSLDSALALTPWNVSYRLRRAAPGDLQAALALSPSRSSVWIALALGEESRNNLIAAEKHLLHAASLDATFAPQWALMNFYLRHGRADQFWKWAGAGVRLRDGDLAGVFQLAFAEAGPGEAWSRLRPERPAAQRQFLELVLARPEFPPASGEAALALARHGRAKDRDLLLSFIERSLQSNRTQPGLEVWNAMATAGLHPLGSLDPIGGRVLTNGTFRFPPSGSGFDWRIPGPPAGASIHPAATGLAIELDGRHNEALILLRQILPALPETRYRLSVRTASTRGALAGGLRWRIGTQISPPLTQSTWDFVSPPSPQSASLELISGRESGQTSPEGAIVLERVSIDPI